MISSRYKALLTNTLLFAVNTIATKIISFILVPLYTSYMSAGEFGLADMSTTVISLVTPLATLAIADAVVRFMVENETHKGLYAAVGFLVTTSSILVVWILSPLLRLPVFGGLDRYRDLFLLAYGATALMNYCGNVARGLDRIRIIPICACISSVITCASAVLLLARLGFGVRGYFISIALGPIAGICGYLLFGGLLKSVYDGFRALSSLKLSDVMSRLIQPMFLYSLPLIPNSLFWWISTSINRFYITGMIGITATGLFAAASRMPSLINAVYSIFQQAWQLSSFQEAKNEGIERFYENVFVLIQASMTMICSAICCFAPMLARLMLRGETYSSWPMIGLLCMANLMNVFNSFYGTVYTSTMNTTYIMRTTIYGSVACIALTPILIHFLGVRGACIASAVGQGLVFVLRAKRSSAFIAFDPHWGILATSIVALVLQSLVTGFVLPYWQVISGVLLCVVMCLQIMSVVTCLRGARQ